MLATIERVQILEQAEEIAQMIIQSEIADYYMSCLYKVKNNADHKRKSTRLSQ